MPQQQQQQQLVGASIPLFDEVVPRLLQSCSATASPHCYLSAVLFPLLLLCCAAAAAARCAAAAAAVAAG
jgi:hypothetical protein